MTALSLTALALIVGAVLAIALYVYYLKWSWVKSVGRPSESAAYLALLRACERFDVWAFAKKEVAAWRDEAARCRQRADIPGPASVAWLHKARWYDYVADRAEPLSEESWMGRER